MRIKPTIAINDNGFLFDPNTGESYTTNPVGREIVFHLKNGMQENEIKEEIRARYDVEEITLEKNMIDFFAMLKHYNLSEEKDK
ncbi:PqqD family protein [Geofilum rubicundum]|uniref:HPr-rel-A system PqqD family protein n=1 Tax=Geofilum rubicundum JCM 15548 TaxID=1236989 RepID=A0A0E9LV33_9BACT|nr:PqqD family protein [Geofilum rubicundum]GAO28976.1 hypothetical protein JCM15548_11125 [Geofilum rubicundum JCM 15548]